MSSGIPPRIVLVGARADLAAQPFDTEWGLVQIAGPGGGQGESADLAVVLDPHLRASPPPARRELVWHPDAPVDDGPATVIARPWPVADDLFDLPSSAREDVCVLLAAEPSDGEALRERLTERGLDARLARGLTRELLAEARIVVCLTPRLPAETFAILATGRLLVAPAGGLEFGLQPWIDHFTFSNEDDLVEVVDALVTYPEAWAPVEAVARQTAEPHRASQAIGRVVRRIQAAAR